MSRGVIEIASGEARAAIALRGAELLTWRCGATDLLWTPDATVWDRVSPLLFPVVGWCRDGEIRVDGRAYPMGVHGFAAAMDFELVERQPDSVRLRLRSNAQTRARYPFEFEFEASYRLAPDSMCIELTARNTGAGDMPYACGVHPGFRWPFPGSQRPDCVIHFERAEATHVPVIAPGGLFSTDMRPVPLGGKMLALTDDVFAHEALCFLNARSNALVFEAADGASVTARFSNLPHIALWTKPPAPYLCIEGWSGHGDPVGFTGELSEKPSMNLLEPGETGRHAASFTWRPARQGSG